MLRTIKEEQDEEACSKAGRVFSERDSAISLDDLIGDVGQTFHEVLFEKISLYDIHLINIALDDYGRQSLNSIAGKESPYRRLFPYQDRGMAESKSGWQIWEIERR